VAGMGEVGRDGVVGAFEPGGVASQQLHHFRNPRLPSWPASAHPTDTLIGALTDAGHDLAFRQMTVTHEPLAAIIGQLVGVTLSKAATSASTACAKSARP
jgi:hypothetical protein